MEEVYINPAFLAPTTTAHQEIVKELTQFLKTINIEKDQLYRLKISDKNLQNLVNELDSMLNDLISKLRYIDILIEDIAQNGGWWGKLFKTSKEKDAEKAKEINNMMEDILVDIQNKIKTHVLTFNSLFTILKSIAYNMNNSSETILNSQLTSIEIKFDTLQMNTDKLKELFDKYSKIPSKYKVGGTRNRKTRRVNKRKSKKHLRNKRKRTSKRRL